MGDDGPIPQTTRTPQLAKTSRGKTQQYNVELKGSDLNGQSPATTIAAEQHSKPSTGLFGRLRSLVTNTPTNGEAITINGADALANAPRARREMIERVIAFDEKRVFDVMMPRADIAAVDINTSLTDLIQLFSDAGHSRMPVYRGDLDDPVGMVHIKDLIGTIAENGGGKPHDDVLKNIQRKILYVPPSMRVVDLFLRMQASRIHMALVIDEYGGTDGLVTIEDLIEEIVGEINDEHDDDEGPMIVERNDGGWDADARIELEELTPITGTVFEDNEDDIGTLGGLVFALAGRVPVRGEVINHPSGFEFEITEADVRKIRKIRIRPLQRHASSEQP